MPRSSTARRQQQRFTSRCHVADVAQAVLADMRRRCGDEHTQQQQGQQQLPLVDVINVVDDEPAPRGDVEAFALQLLGGAAAAAAGAGATAAPPAVPAGASGSAEQGSSQPRGSGTDSDSSEAQQLQQPRLRRSSEPLEEKRVANGKLKQQLGVVLAAPTFRQGLAALHAGDISPFGAADLECLYETH